MGYFGRFLPIFWGYVDSKSQSENSDRQFGFSASKYMGIYYRDMQAWKKIFFCVAVNYFWWFEYSIIPPPCSAKKISDNMSVPLYHPVVTLYHPPPLRLKKFRIFLVSHYTTPLSHYITPSVPWHPFPHPIILYHSPVALFDYTTPPLPKHSPPS